MCTHKNRISNICHISFDLFMLNADFHDGSFKPFWFGSFVFDFFPLCFQLCVFFPKVCFCFLLCTHLLFPFMQAFVLKYLLFLPEELGKVAQNTPQPLASRSLSKSQFVASDNLSSLTEAAKTR